MKSSKGWIEDEFPDLKKLRTSLIPPFFQGGYNAYNTCTTLIISHQTPDWLQIKPVIAELQESQAFSASFAPELTSIGGHHVAKGTGALVSVNKGAVFRMILNKVIEKRQIQHQGSTPIVFVFGDSTMDLTMLVPTMEIKAYGPVNEDAIKKRDLRFIAADVGAENLSDISWWEKSIIPTGARLSRKKCCGEYVEQALKEPKVIVSDGWGVASLIEGVVDQLENRFGESQHEIQAY